MMKEDQRLEFDKKRIVGYLVSREHFQRSKAGKPDCRWLRKKTSAYGDSRYKSGVFYIFYPPIIIIES